MSKPIADRVFIKATGLAAWLLVALLIAVIISLCVSSWPAIRHFGLSFIWKTQWNPYTEEFGAVTAIFGTVISSIIALVIAVPISVGVAVLITQILPHAIGQTVARVIELMAGIPSIIYGMWGLFIFAPLMARSVQPKLIDVFQHIPILNYVFGGLPIGIGIFTAGIILAIMIIPLISSMMRDVLANVPELIKEAAYGIGATRWEVTFHVLMRYTRAGLVGGVILGLGRALGETMAVTFVIGNAHHWPTGLFMPGTTISAAIANEFNEATGKLYPAALMELSLILMVITFVTLFFSRWLLRHSKRRGGSQ